MSDSKVSKPNILYYLLQSESSNKPIHYGFDILKGLLNSINSNVSSKDENNNKLND